MNRYHSYQSSAYDELEAQLERQYGLPSGLMRSIRTRGERSNADQISHAGARTVYQVIPSTRELFKKKYGVDAYASPQDAARVAALHLKESLDRGGDPVREYIGGTDRRNWGSQTAAYARRVRGGQDTNSSWRDIISSARAQIDGGDAPGLPPDASWRDVIRSARNQLDGGGQPRQTGLFRGLPGEKITSTYRNPEHNREVGGVENSFHTRRDPWGRALARDSVPPPGISMAAYAAQLQRLNPDMEVINEGDHVHMEPRGSAPRRPSPAPASWRDVIRQAAASLNPDDD